LPSPASAPKLTLNIDRPKLTPEEKQLLEAQRKASDQ
jgi:hypothetical protein